jgi:hypothetical protein
MLNLLVRLVSNDRTALLYPNVNGWRRSAGRGGNRQHGPPAEDDRFGYDAWECFREPIEATIAIGYSAAAFAEDAGMLNRAFCSSLSVA